MGDNITRRRNRPGALDVSFQDDEDVQMSGPFPQSGPVSNLKRNASHRDDSKGVKNKRAHFLPQAGGPPLPEITKYFDPNSMIDSDMGPFLFEEGANGTHSKDDGPPAKSIRELDDFTFVRTSTDCMVPLRVEVEPFQNRFRGEGIVTPHLDTDEAEEEEQDGELTDEAPEGIRMILKEVTFVKVDFKENIFVETPHALYLLKRPSKDYRIFHDRFMRLVEVTKLLITACRTGRRTDIVQRIISEKAPFKAPYSEEYTMGDVLEAVPMIKYALTFLHDYSMLRNHSTFKTLGQRLQIDLPIAKPWPSLRNTDVSVLDPANQTQTVVTPYLGELSIGLFHEEMEAVGKEWKKTVSRAHLSHEERLEQLKACEGRPGRKQVRYPFRSQEHVLIDGVEYRPGDAVFVSATPSQRTISKKENPSTLPERSTLFDHFWLALVISWDRDTNTMHVIWLEHSSQTLMGEISEPQMVFLTDICDRIDARSVMGKGTINFAQISAEQLRALNDDEFYCWLKYNANDGTMSSIDILNLRSSIESRRCPLCLSSDTEDPTAVVEIEGGILIQNQQYHVHDFVLIRREADDSDGPAHIGRITRIASPKATHRDPFQVTIQKLGRIRDVVNLPQNMLRDERHLFLTNDTETIPAELLLAVVYVLHKDQLPQLDFWLEHSPHHLYIEYRISLQETSYYWLSHEVLPQDAEEIAPCVECYKKRFSEVRRLHNFKSRTRLRALDLFSGVGAFSSGIAEGAGNCVVVTHAIEIAPSAAKTCARNSPHTKVYNQCANTILKWCIKAHHGFNVEVPMPMHGDNKPFEDPIKPGDIDMIICGVPCQPHSSLNVYKRADDRKSHLLVNFLSWVDFLKPRFVFMENVRGFTTFRLNALQYDRYRVGGGIESGGLKFIYHALTQLGYQVRCGLLQAGHYGVPQTRVRFFLIAAKNGERLPQFPQPSHDFPLVDGLEISLPQQLKSIGSIWTTRGTAAHHLVSIVDAIGDLPKFDWKYPGSGKEPDILQRVAEQRRTLKIPTFECHTGSAKCGFAGTPKYTSQEPRTRFQKFARAIRTEDIQHFTLKLKELRVKQVLSIPLKANADYQSIPQHLGNWMLTNQSSALARQGYRPGRYFGRLDQNRWFNTIVTNLHPTAKQSKVLHPTDRRMYTVREFARAMSFRDSFVFEGINDSVVTLHRQIGNAVPWLLAKAIGAEFVRALFEQDQEERRVANET